MNALHSHIQTSSPEFRSNDAAMRALVADLRATLVAGLDLNAATDVLQSLEDKYLVPSGLYLDGGLAPRSGPKSPYEITGVVTRVPAHVGELALPGQVLIAVSDLSTLKLTLYVRLADLGHELEVALALPGEDVARARQVDVHDPLDPPAVHDGDPITHPLEFVQIVRGHHDDAVGTPHGIDDLSEPGRPDRIQAVRGLVEHHESHVVAQQRLQTFVDKCEYITSPGKRISCCISTMGRFEKRGGDEFVLTGYFGMNFTWLDDQLNSWASWFILGLLLPILLVVVSSLALASGGYTMPRLIRRRKPRTAPPPSA